MGRQFSKKTVKFLKFPDIEGLELLHAAYTRQKFSPHYHEGHVIGVIEKGCLGFDYRGEKVIASSGEINLADPGEVHNGFSVSQEGWQYRMFYLRPGQLGRICNELRDTAIATPFFKKGVIKDPAFARELHLLHRDFENPAISLLEKESRFHILMTHFILRHSPKRIAPICPGAEKKIIAKIKAYIHGLYDSNICLDDLSRVAGISRYYLLRVFARETGLTPHTYLNLVRASKAKELMAKKVPIMDTAHAIGFFDQSHLNRIFKKIYGITPGQYCRAV